MGEAKRKASSFVAEIDEMEMAARFAEIAMGLKRPPGMSGAAVIAEAEQKAKASGDPHAVYAVQCWRHMARAAIAYLGECIDKGKTPN